ncbi:MAG: right-handed parallel beta-helix repeat-containing protein [Candidatus Hydrogenedentes bacterium]|nr:right-handed parallel beta-helix repeat-containing protein [Candidatus Hydrogenedentota bacterium]
MRSIPPPMSRRALLRSAAAMSAAAFLPAAAPSTPMPAVRAPRATSGDTAHEPAWDERMTVTVGPGSADIAGTTDKAIQAAVDYVVRLGGGTVHVQPGTYTLRNTIYLRRGVRLLGSGPESVLVKCASHDTTLADDSDWYDQEITLENPDGFAVGDGVILETKNPHHGGLDVLRRTLVARSGNRFKLDRALRNNFWTAMAPSVSSRFPMITAEETTGFAVENIALDGNRANNANINGNYAGALWFQDCSDIHLRGLHVRAYNGDGISFQICHDVRVEDCVIEENADLGIHPGSGSQRPAMRNNQVSGSNIGIFFCWGVKYGLAEGNHIEACNFGVSIGHHDDENLVIDNEIRGSHIHGVVFRPERGEGFTATGNRFERNRIIDSGGDAGVAVDVQGVTANNTLARNTIRETRGPAERVGIQLGPETGSMALVDNIIEGFATPVRDLRTA